MVNKNSQTTNKKYAGLSSSDCQTGESIVRQSSPVTKAVSPISASHTAVVEDPIKIFSNPENCTAALILQHLSRHNDHEDGHKGIFVFLVNKLYDVKTEEMEFYMPELLNIFVNKCTEKKSDLECVTSLHFGIKMSWYVDAECSQQFLEAMTLKGADALHAQKQHQRMLGLRNLVEEVTINQRLPSMYLDEASQAVNIQGDEDRMLDAFANKERRLAYFHDQHRFMWFMTDLSSRLRQYPLGSVRAQRMRVELEAANKFIPNGVYVPCCYMDETHRRIVRIVVGECNVFSTKERVPYMVTVESIGSPFTVSHPVISFVAENSHVLQETTEMLQERSKREAENVPTATLSIDEEKENMLKKLALHVDPNGPLNDIEARIGSLDLEERRKKLEEFEKDFEEYEKKEIERRLGARKNKLDDETMDRNALMYACFGESDKERADRIAEQSPFGKSLNWSVQSFIVKANDDMRQEHFAMQLVERTHRIFIREQVPLYLRPYHVIVTDRDSGLMECLVDSTSLHSLKKKYPNFTNLSDYWKVTYGNVGTEAHTKALNNFVESVAGYSVLCYILQIKDRHNGNIMVHRDGHIIHIDYGFLLGNSPGAITFENAPFKLTQEFVDLMGGVNSIMFKNFTMLVHLGLKCLTKHKQEIISLVEMMGNQKFPCFENAHIPTVIRDLNARFKSDLNELEYAKWSKSLVDEALYSWRTRQYDNFQKLTNGIIP
ncbi:phosphatidylinositol 4-kinase [Acrasis kona]|uniref:1-phosphatidylinositol 4-kinase n=1 Tax=Acrasis kona TaxID=1008807 RepID=A0AAW2YZ91_9EUKA